MFRASVVDNLAQVCHVRPKWWSHAEGPKGQCWSHAVKWLTLSWVMLGIYGTPFWQWSSVFSFLTLSWIYTILLPVKWFAVTQQYILCRETVFSLNHKYGGLNERKCISLPSILQRWSKFTDSHKALSHILKKKHSFISDSVKSELWPKRSLKSCLCVWPRNKERPAVGDNVEDVRYPTMLTFIITVNVSRHGLQLASFLG